MSWRKSIPFARPLRAVCHVRPGTRDATTGVPGVADASAAEIENARREGYQAGHEDAEREMAARSARVQSEFGNAVENVARAMSDAVSRVIRDSERHLVELTLDIARKLVADLPIAVEMVEAAVREALLEVEGATEIHVRLHPQDRELLEQSNSKLLTAAREGAQVRFHGAPEVSRGGCLVQTRFGVIDGRRETKLELLAKALQE